jgi:nitrogen fixation protein FixH
MMTALARKPFRFTGWHMTAILVAFFGVVIVVNVGMARLASHTFSGVVVENSYDASQQFDRWLDEAAKEQALGWHAQVARQADGHVVVTLTGKGWIRRF